MAGPKFSKREAIRFGWSTTIGNLGLFVVAAIIVVMINALPAITKSAVVSVVAWVLILVVSLGIMRMSLRFVDGDRGKLADLFATFPLLIKYLLASILTGIIVMIGMILLIIPGVFLAVRLQMYGWAIVDKEAGPIEALRQSWEMTRGSFWNLFLLGLLLALVNLLGALALGVGLLVTIPLSIVAMGQVYRKLEGAGAASI